jgi:hypothetical protein
LEPAHHGYQDANADKAEARLARERVAAARRAKSRDPHQQQSQQVDQPVLLYVSLVQIAYAFKFRFLA